MGDWIEQEVLNEVDARRRNEWIEETNDSYGALAATDEYVCECSDAACTTLIRLSRGPRYSRASAASFSFSGG